MTQVSARPSDSCGQVNGQAQRSQLVWIRDSESRRLVDACERFCCKLQANKFNVIYNQSDPHKPDAREREREREDGSKTREAILLSGPQQEIRNADLFGGNQKVRAKSDRELDKTHVSSLPCVARVASLCVSS